MTCPRCMFRLEAASQRAASQCQTRSFSVMRPLGADPSTQITTTESQKPALHILRHRARPVRVPNEKLRSAAHDLEISSRQGVKYAQSVVGRLEFQNSTYHYNKQTSKNLAVLPEITTKLLDAYASMRPAKLDENGKKVPTKGADMINWRKNAQKIYIGEPTVRDYGHKVVIDAFYFDGLAHTNNALNEREEKQAARIEKKEAQGSSTGRDRRPPPRTGRAPVRR